MPIVRHGYAKHRRNGSTRQWRTTRAMILANADRCAITGQPPTPTDPLEVDHIIPVADGGTDHPSNLRAVLRSVNRARGRAMPRGGIHQ